MYLPKTGIVGRCILQLKRHCGDVAETTPEELLEWLTIVKVLEKALHTAFDATMFNWSCYRITHTVIIHLNRIFTGGLCYDTITQYG
jgi:diadenosine tetraphosphate (Ap4A) HIT family hydrolase